MVVCLGYPHIIHFILSFSIINHLFLGTTIYGTPQMMILQTVYELGFTTTVKSTIFSWPFPNFGEGAERILRLTHGEGKRCTWLCCFWKLTEAV
jgi:hypothetical protein